MDVREFQEKLKKMQELAKEQGGSLRAEQIREEFSGSDLNRSQLVNVLKYLTGQGILIEGIETETEGSDAQEEVRRVPLTQEEEAYLKEYLESLPGEVQSLAACYMRAAARLAVEMNTEDIFIGDLIQEANVSLVQALGAAGEILRSEEWLLEQIREGIRKACKEQSQRKFEDDSLVARVEKLESAVRELSEDEEDGESAFSVGELAVILDMDVEEIRDTLRLTGDDK